MRNLLVVKKGVELFFIADSLTLFKKAVNWGGYESLVFPAAVKYNNDSGVPAKFKTLICLHIGLEETEMVLEDIRSALKGL